MLIEQRLLPHEFRVVRTRDFKETARAITDMIVRGAGAIGATAAYGYAQGLRAFQGDELKKFEAHAHSVFDVLAKARPTAVDPVNAMHAIQSAMEKGKSIAEKKEIVLREAEAFGEEDVQHCREIGEHGVHLIPEGARVLTHCNAGWLAFVDLGSATAPMYAAHAAGRKF